jgi:hypothetical protein
VTLFALLCQVCGLSHREAAEFHGVRLDTVKSWSAGRNRPPEGVIRDLAQLAERIDHAAAGAAAQIEAMVAGRSGRPDEIELGLASDDVEARAIGWPCVGAQRACVARIVAFCARREYPCRIVPRGSTVAAADVNDVNDKEISRR